MRASVAFSPDGRMMVFAKGNSGKRKGDNDVNLFISYFRNGKWTTPKKMNINDINAWDSTPAFNRTGRRLYGLPTGKVDMGEPISGRPPVMLTEGGVMSKPGEYHKHLGQ